VAKKNTKTMPDVEEVEDNDADNDDVEDKDEDD